MAAEQHFIDTDVFLRHLFADHDEQSPRARGLFIAVEKGERTVWTTHLVIAELVFVLQGQHFQLPRDQIAGLILPLVDLPNLKVPQKAVIRAAFELYISRAIDFIDCYHAALVLHRGELRILSFDQDFDRFGGVERVEP